MIKVIKYDAKLHYEWDQYVEKHAEATPYHRRAWLDSIKSAYGFTDRSWLALDNEEKVIGVISSALIKTPIVGTKLSALPYCDAGGVLSNNEKAKSTLLNTVLAYMKEQGIAKFEHRRVNLELSDDVLAEQSKVRMILPLPNCSEALFSSFKSKLRSQVRKAEKNGLTATLGNDKGHLDGFYRVYAKNMRDLGSPAHSKKWFESIIGHYLDNAVVANVYSGNEVIGAGLVLMNGSRCSIPWASTNSEFNRLAPNMLLYWTLLAYAADNGYSEFDFGRSSPGEGTYKFKKQWGAEPSGLLWQDYLNGELIEGGIAASSVENVKVSRMRHWVESVWRRLPVNIATLLGSYLRKYISL